MKFRGSRVDAARRGYSNLTRTTLRKVHDEKKLQHVDVDLLHDETKQKIERFQNYGISSNPHPPTGDERAEAVVAFMSGNRSHGVVLAIDDRRYRFKDLKNGEVALYDDLGQSVHLTREGLRVKTPLNCDLEAEGNVTMKSGGIFHINPS